MAAQRDYQRIVEEVAALLGAPATLEDRDFTLVAFAAHEGDADVVADDVRARSILSRRSSPQVKAWFESFGITRATRPVRIPADPATGVRARLCLPARHGGVTYGSIWLLDPGGAEWPDTDLAAAFALAGRAGDLLAEEAHAGTELGERLRALVTGTGDPQAVAALEAAGARTGTGPYAVVVVRGGLPDPLTVLGQASVVAAYTGAFAPDPEPDELVALIRTPRAPTEPARRLARLRKGTRAGVSAVFTGPAEASAAYAEAVAAVRTARAFPEYGPVASWPELGPYRLVSHLPAAPDPAVAPLLAPRHAELARTAEVYLDRAAHATQAAEVLAIHRQTLYYRLSRVEALTGLDLANGEHRLLLHMGLKAGRMRGG
jgi:hypothetical protein